MRVRKRVTIFILLSAIIIAYIVRVTVVNKNAERTPVVTYNVGEVVDFGTDYIDTADEAIPGYAIQVLGYELVDTKELYDRYNMGEVEEYALKNTPFYCLLKIRFYNNDCDMGEQGGLMLSRYSLVGDNYMSMVSENVFCTMYPDMPGISFSLRQGTSMELELPYPLTRNEGRTKSDMEEKAPMLEISEFPNRKVLKAG